MTSEQDLEAGDELPRFLLTPAVSAERMIANMRSAIARDLPQATECRAHGLTMSVAAGGPSLTDTYRDLDGFIVAVNGSLKFLLDREIKDGASYGCGIMDAGEHIADLIVADRRVRYYVASLCDPKVFDKLEGCDVRLWHVSPESTEDAAGVKALLDEAYPDHWHAIGGGCTMGLRWINLGYFLGFRTFKLHGLDSSFREGATHAYPDRADTKDQIEFAGRLTRPNFLAQIYDFFGTLNRFNEPDLEPITIEVFGDGLLQDQWSERFAGSERGAVRIGVSQVPLIVCVKTGDKYGPEYVTKLRDGVARHLNAPHDFVCFTDQPVEGVRCYPLPADLPGWWAKMGLFKLKRKLIYFDLDVVITGDLAPLIAHDGIGIIKDWWLPGFNSSVMKLTGNEGAVWDKFAGAPHDNMRSCPMGDQQFITRHMTGAATFPREFFPSYKANRCQDAPTKGAMAVIFHGEPKPHQCGGWVADAWRNAPSTQE